jgi:hypothetical protein
MKNQAARLGLLVLFAFASVMTISLITTACSQETQNKQKAAAESAKEDVKDAQIYGKSSKKRKIEHGIETKNPIQKADGNCREQRL